MSRIGRQLVKIPAGVTVEIQEDAITAAGPKGTLRRMIPPEIAAALREGAVEVSPRKETKRTPALWGLTRALIANMVRGVAEGFEKKLEFEGIGYRAGMEGPTLVMQLGFSHPVRFEPPEGIVVKTEKNTITVSGADRELVGQTAAAIRGLKRPEPYKGKGIRYEGEVIRRKVGKKSAAAAI